jgi:tetratricopeptide (TPR) repeat protein
VTRLLLLLPLLGSLAVGQGALGDQVDTFLREIGRAHRYDLPQLEAVLLRWQELQLCLRKGIGEPEELQQQARSFIETSLSELEPAYQRGVSALNEGRAATAADQLLRLLQDDYPYTHLEAYATLRLGQALHDLGQHQAAREQLSRAVEVYGPYLPHRPEALLELAQVQESLGLRSAARSTCERLLAEHQEDRHGALLRQARALLETLREQVTGPLGEVASRMRSSEDRLRDHDCGERTQAVQRSIIELLDELIEQAEQNESSSSSSSSSQQQQSSSPASQSQTRGGSEGPLGLGGDPAELEREAWGNLPDREREDILQQLQERFPARYRDLLEQYYRSIRQTEAR